jgi:hypothetical protein
MEPTDALAAHLLRLGGEYHNTSPQHAHTRADRMRAVTVACQTAVAAGVPVEADRLVRGVLDAVKPQDGPVTGGPDEWLTKFRSWWATTGTTTDSPVPAADNAHADELVPVLDDDGDDDPATPDNTITAPDGSDLLDRYGFTIRTVKAAERKFIQAATVCQAWEDRYNAGLTDVHGAAKASSAWSGTANRILEALAHKRGAVTDDNMDAVEAQLKPRLDKAIATWRAKHPNHE